MTIESATRHKACLWGRAARAALAADGRVIAAFARSFYVETAAGIACLGTADLGAGPLNVLLGTSAAAAIRPGQRVARDGDVLRIADTSVIDLRNASDWQPRAPTSLRAGTTASGLAAICTMDPPGEGIGRLIPALIDAGPGAVDLCDPLLATSCPPLVALRDWVADGAHGPPPASLRTLIGLGPGLTPSGDDALGGAMIALHAFGCGRIAGALADALLPQARNETSSIALAHLTAAAEGQGAAALHDVLADLGDGNVAGLARSVVALGRVGHCSGWDGLAGAVAVLTGLTRRAHGAGGQRRGIRV